jgi:hypothetical protein
MDASELRRQVQEKQKNKQRTFEQIFQQCMRCLRRKADMRLTSCEFRVPAYLFGLPIYNVDDCRAYVVTRLRGLGYEVSTGELDGLHISWSADAKAAGAGVPLRRCAPPAADRYAMLRKFLETSDDADVHETNEASGVNGVHAVSGVHEANGGNRVHEANGVYGHANGVYINGVNSRATAAQDDAFMPPSWLPARLDAQNMHPIYRKVQDSARRGNEATRQFDASVSLDRNKNTGGLVLNFE